MLLKSLAGHWNKEQIQRKTKSIDKSLANLFMKPGNPALDMNIFNIPFQSTVWKACGVETMTKFKSKTERLIIHAPPPIFPLPVRLLCPSSAKKKNTFITNFLVLCLLNEPCQYEKWVPYIEAAPIAPGYVIHQLVASIYPILILSLKIVLTANLQIKFVPFVKYIMKNGKAKFIAK